LLRLHANVHEHISAWRQPKNIANRGSPNFTSRIPSRLSPRFAPSAAPPGLLRRRSKRRHEFITLIGSAADAWPLAARAQQSVRARRIGVLMYWTADDEEGQVRLAAFTEALKQLGWIDGENLRIDTRWAKADDIRKHAAELVALARTPQPRRRCLRRPAPCPSCSRL
jgi:hypothetical protein